MNLPQHLLTVPEAARYLGLGKTTVYSLMDSGKLPYVRFGASRRIRPQDLVDLINRNTVGARAA